MVEVNISLNVDCAHETRVDCDRPQVAKWKSALDAQLERVSERRPKRLLVFINPFGGAGRAQEVFADKVRAYTDDAAIV